MRNLGLIGTIVIIIAQKKENDFIFNKYLIDSNDKLTDVMDWIKK